MNNTPIILDLISDDRYLLWEVKAVAVNAFDLNNLIQEVIDLVKRRIVICSSGAILGDAPIMKLSIKNSIIALENISNWCPPKSDLTKAIWLEIAE